MAYKPPIIAIIGRPNVGKSTLFNRALGEQRAVVEDEPGVTRDRNYAFVEKQHLPFLLVDTGGIELGTGGVIEEQVVQQATLALEEADVVLVMFDGNEGVRPGDSEVVALARKYEKPTYFLVNKCDGAEQSDKIYDFYSLGLERLIDCSALHGHNVSLLFQTVLSELPNYEALKQSYEAERELRLEREQEAKLFLVEEEEDPKEFEQQADTFVEEAPRFAPVYSGEEQLDEKTYLRQERVRPILKTVSQEKLQAAKEDAEAEPVRDLKKISVAIVGKPNVGKSTLLNRLVGEERAITSPIAGTTRDALDLTITRNGVDYQIIDTAGLRKQAKIKEKIERYSTLRTLRVLNDADVAVVVLDAEDGLGSQDEKIVGLAHEAGKGIVLVVNKWDLVEKDHKSVKDFTEKIRSAFKFVPYAPIIFVSALSGKRCPRVIETVREIAHNRLRRVSTGALNRVLRNTLKRVTLPIYRGRPVKFYYASQVAVSPPRFVLFFNQPKAVHFSNLRAFKNSIRDAFPFVGTDVKLSTKKRGEK